jgi:hypothetical protein
MNETKKIEYSATDSFRKDLKKLLKRYNTLESDLEVAKINAIELCHLKRIDNHSVFQIPGYNTDQIKVYKIKKFACRALKGRGAKSGLRVIYALHLDTMKIVFIEMYYKGDQPNEDQARIKDYLKLYS